MFDLFWGPQGFTCATGVNPCRRRRRVTKHQLAKSQQLSLTLLTEERKSWANSLDRSITASAPTYGPSHSDQPWITVAMPVTSLAVTGSKSKAMRMIY